MMTETMIEKLTEKGFSRWTKGAMDRLYINANDLGLYTDHYKSGSICFASFNGEEISHAHALRMLGAKTWIDVETGLLNSKYAEDCLVEAAEAIYEQAKAEIAAEEAAAQEPAAEESDVQEVTAEEAPTTDIKLTRTIDEGSYTAMEYVMTLDGEEIGWASLNVDSKSSYCERIDIDEAHRNHGHGTAFLKALSDEYGSIFLAPDNEDAQRLYDRLGYDVTDKGDWWAVDQGYGVYEI